MQLVSQPKQMWQWDVFLLYFSLIIVWMNPKKLVSRKTAETEKHLRRSRLDDFWDSAPWTLQCSARRCAAFAQKWLRHMEVTGSGESDPDKNSMIFGEFYLMILFFGCETPPTGNNEKGAIGCPDHRPGVASWMGTKFSWAPGPWHLPCF